MELFKRLKIQWLIFCLSISCFACNKSDFPFALTDKKQESRTSDRPDESSEGLPGYLFCRTSQLPQSDGDDGKINCRVENNRQKLSMPATELNWELSTDEDVLTNWEPLDNDSPWHTVGTLKSKRAESIKNALVSSIITVKYQDVIISSPIANSYAPQSDDSPILTERSLNVFFSPNSEAGGFEWARLGSSLNGPASEISELIQVKGQQLNWSVRLEPSESQLEIRAMPNPFFGNSPWVDLANHALLTSGDMEHSISGLEPGIYKFRILAMASPDLASEAYSPMAVEIWKSGSFQRISQEESLAQYRAEQDPIATGEQFTIFTFEAVVDDDQELRFIIRKLSPDNNVIQINAIVIGYY